jgi:fatty-acyl-CoA synthase
MSAGRTFFQELTRGASLGGTYRVATRWDNLVERTFSDVLEEVETRAAGLAERGVEPGHTVAILSGTSFDFVVGTLAVWRAGATLAPLHAPAAGTARDVWAERTNRVLGKVKPDLLLVGPGMPVFDSSVPTFSVGDLESSVRLDPQLDGPDGWAPLILFTSGSTGEPKGMVLGRQAVLSRAESEDRLDLDPSVHRTFSFSPTHFIPGVAQVARPLAQGMSTTLVPTHLVGGDPGRWIVELSRQRITHTGGFSEAYKLAARAIEAGLEESVDLSCLQVVTCTGEVIDHVSLEAFSKAAAPLGFDPGTFTLKYAMTEGGLISSSKPGRGLLVDRVSRSALDQGLAEPASGAEDGVAEFPSAGEPMPFITLRILSDEGEELGERRVGHIVVKSPNLMDGYLDDPGATAETITDGWLQTGDLGYLADGDLYIAGRSKLMIIVRSKNFFAEDLEQVVENVTGISRGRSVAFGVRRGSTEEAVIVAEPVPDGADDAEGLPRQVTKALWRQLGLRPLDVVIVKPDSLPRTSTGKLGRQEIKRLFESQDLGATVLAQAKGRF